MDVFEVGQIVVSGDLKANWFNYNFEHLILEFGISRLTKKSKFNKNFPDSNEFVSKKLFIIKGFFFAPRVRLRDKFLVSVQSWYWFQLNFIYNGENGKNLANLVDKVSIFERKEIPREKWLLLYDVRSLLNCTKIIGVPALYG